MDNLAKCMIQCKKDGYGCHYGAWRAAQGDILIVNDDGIPEGWKKCEYCGELFKPSRSDQKFCGAYCQRQNADKRFREKRKANGKA